MLTRRSALLAGLGICVELGTHTAFCCPASAKDLPKSAVRRSSRRSRMRGGLQLECLTPSPSPLVQLQSYRRKKAYSPVQARAWTTLVLPIYFHIIHDGKKGKVPPDKIDEQLRILNAASSGGRMKFAMRSLQYVDRSDWFEMHLSSEQERNAKSALARETDKALNFYTADLSGSHASGYARQPWEYKTEPQLDGVVVNYVCLPGGAPPFNRGGVGVHEVGHWLGLHHTYERGCDWPGDQVDDTPYQRVTTRDCEKKRDSCTGPKYPGSDPVTNYMDSSSDDCRRQFTPGQFWRIRTDVLPYYRPSLGLS